MVVETPCRANVGAGGQGVLHFVQDDEAYAVGIEITVDGICWRAGVRTGGD